MLSGGGTPRRSLGVHSWSPANPVGAQFQTSSCCFRSHTVWLLRGWGGPEPGPRVRLSESTSSMRQQDSKPERPRAAWTPWRTLPTLARDFVDRGVAGVQPLSMTQRHSSAALCLKRRALIFSSPSHQMITWLVKGAISNPSYLV